VLLGLPALAPLVFMAPSVLRLDSATHAAGNDVLGTGGAMLLFATLAVTPLVTVTGHRWFAPLRQWYGIVFALDVILDLVIAANDPAFGYSVTQDLTGHTFLLAGAVMVTIAVPLLITANRRSMRWLGRYWKTVQAAGTYAIWAILAVHLALLEGLRPGPGGAEGIKHQRLYQYAACSLPLVILRLPPVRRWYARRRGSRTASLATGLLIAIFASGYVFFANELIYKGVAAYRLDPVND
jgi:DMSO/TMAO reductase YedYZ heme-binding membrane subunit